jgi:hypothetical protein
MYNIQINVIEAALAVTHWIHLTPDEEGWRSFVNTLMNGFHKRQGSS